MYSMYLHVRSQNACADVICAMSALTNYEINHDKDPNTLAHMFPYIYIYIYLYAHSPTTTYLTEQASH